MRWLFPDNKKAENASVLDQALKVREEANEVFSATLNHESEARILEEAMDNLQSLEGLFKKFPLHKVLIARARVIVKCARRGDYK